MDVAGIPIFGKTINHDAVLRHPFGEFEWAGADRVLLGSDYPFDMGDPDPVGCIEACGMLDAAQRAALAGGNAAALFGLGGMERPLAPR